MSRFWMARLDFKVLPERAYKVLLDKMGYKVRRAMTGLDYKARLLLVAQLLSIQHFPAHPAIRHFRLALALPLLMHHPVRRCLENHAALAARLLMRFRAHPDYLAARQLLNLPLHHPERPELRHRPPRPAGQLLCSHHSLNCPALPARRFLRLGLERL